MRKPSCCEIILPLTDINSPSYINAVNFGRLIEIKFKKVLTNEIPLSLVRHFLSHGSCSSCPRVGCSGGTIRDPENGKTYKCYIAVVDGGKRLKVRGYLGISIFGRTQYWIKE